MDTEDEHRLCAKLVESLALVCCAPTDMIMKQLTGYLWDENEANSMERFLNDLR